MLIFQHSFQSQSINNILHSEFYHIRILKVESFAEQYLNQEVKDFDDPI